jgi:alkaline phosphatase D
MAEFVDIKVCPLRFVYLSSFSDSLSQFSFSAAESKMQPLLFLSLASAVAASYAGNLNYRSPSHVHPALGVSIRKVAARNAYPATVWDPAKLKFTHGVASGDPYDDSVILWTRVAPIGEDNSASELTVTGYVPLYDHDNEAYVAQSKAPVCIQYTVASDKALKKVVDHGTVYTSSDVDYTVKVCRPFLSPEGVNTLMNTG